MIESNESINSSESINYQDPINYIIEKLSMIKGYNNQWITMISSNPLIFEDVDYMRILPYINNTITNEELDAYNNGNLKNLYSSFEYLLISNIQYYDRIMTFCTMYFLNYYRIDDVVVDDNIPNHIINMDGITPTRLYCITMLNNDSTKWEQEYAYGGSLKNNSFIANYPYLKKDKLYAFFLSQRAFVHNTFGYRETLLSDKIDDLKYYQICKKFIQSSNTISRQQLNILSDYIITVDKQILKLYTALEKSMESLYDIDKFDNYKSYQIENSKRSFSIHVFFDEFFIHTTHFTMKVYKLFNDKTKTITVSKDYLSNSYECFIAEPYFKNSVRQQIEWSKYKISNKFSEIQTILKNILLNILNINFKDVICIKYMCDMENIANKDNVDLSIVEFTGVFSNIFIKTTLKQGESVVCRYSKCLSKNNAAEYLINKGYYIFGYKDDVYKLLNLLKSSQYSIDEKIEFIKNNLSKYTTDIKEFLRPIIHIYKNQNKKLINIYKNENEDIELSNDMIYLSDIRSQKFTNVNSLIKHINKSLKFKDSKNTEQKTYHQIINT